MRSSVKQRLWSRFHFPKYHFTEARNTSELLEVCPDAFLISRIVAF
jgi:hypothetical protein